MSELSRLLGTIEPELHAGVYAFTSVPPGTDWSNVPVLSTFLESEGVSVILPEADARALGWPILFSAAWITLTVHSDLQSVGLTAAVSAALAEAHRSAVTSSPVFTTIICSSRWREARRRSPC